MGLKVIAGWLCVWIFVAGAKGQSGTPLTELLFKRESDSTLRQALAPFTPQVVATWQSEKRVTYSDSRQKMVLSIFYRYSKLDSEYYAATITAYGNTDKKSRYGMYKGALINGITWQQDWQHIKDKIEGTDIFTMPYGVKYHNSAFNWISLAFEKVTGTLSAGYVYMGLSQVTVSTMQNMPE